MASNLFIYPWYRTREITGMADYYWLLLDSKLLCGPHLQHSMRKSRIAFQRVKRIVGEHWRVGSSQLHLLYTSCIHQQRGSGVVFRFRCRCPRQRTNQLPEELPAPDHPRRAPHLRQFPVVLTGVMPICTSSIWWTFLTSRRTTFWAR